MASTGRLAVCVRNFTTSAVRRAAVHDEGGIPEANMPFEFGNRYKLSANFLVFFGIPFAIPFLLLRHQLLKK